jgi:IS1 family transposase
MRYNEVYLDLWRDLTRDFGITQYYTDYWVAYTRHLDPEEHTPGKRNTQKIERKHASATTRLTSVHPMHGKTVR